LILATNQFTGMSTERALNPASNFDEKGELEAWDLCVDKATIFWEQGINAIPKPFDNFDYTYTHSYSDAFAKKHPNGVRIGDTWFYSE